MRPLSRLWQAIESIPGQTAIPSFWAACCGPEFELVRPHLRVTDEEGTHYPCPGPQMGYCPRRIVDHPNGEYVALCRDPHERCERVTLVRRDVLLQELDITTFMKGIAAPLGVRWQIPIARGKGIWAVGVSDAPGTRGQPAFLALLHDGQHFVGFLQRLLLHQPGPLVVIAPTARHRTVEVLELLQAHRSTFLALEERLFLGENGRIVAGLTGGDGPALAATPVAERPSAVRAFMKRHKCKVKDIHEAAGVHQTDYYRWLKGTIQDHYSTSIAIEKILASGFQASRPRKRRSVED